MNSRMSLCFCVLLISSCFRSEGPVLTADRAEKPAVEKKFLVKLDGKNGSQQFKVEVADSPAKREQGLMFREALEKDSGMIFLFDEEKENAFWMKNTRLPLDIIFFDKNWRIVGFLENMEPFSTKGRTITTPSKFVLEVNAGLVQKMGFKVGDVGSLVEVK